jgi:hypothetical protein
MDEMEDEIRNRMGGGAPRSFLEQQAEAALGDSVEDLDVFLAEKDGETDQLLIEFRTPGSPRSSIRSNLTYIVDDDAFTGEVRMPPIAEKSFEITADYQEYVDQFFPVTPAVNFRYTTGADYYVPHISPRGVRGVERTLNGVARMVAQYDADDLGLPAAEV